MIDGVLYDWSFRYHSCQPLQYIIISFHQIILMAATLFLSSLMAATLFLSSAFHNEVNQLIEYAGYVPYC